MQTRRFSAGYVFPTALGRILLSPDPDPRAGDDPKDDAKDRAPTLDDMRRLIDERGAEHAAKSMLDVHLDNFKLRSKLREARKQATPEGAAVLTGDEAKHWRQFAELGLSPGDVKKLREEHGTLASWKRGREQADTLAEAAALHGWKPSALTRFARADGLEVVVDDSGEKDKDGKPVRKGFVVTRGEDGQESGRKPLDEYAATQWEDDLDLLRGQAAKSDAAVRDDPRRPMPRQPDPLDRELAPTRLL